MRNSTILAPIATLALAMGLASSASAATYTETQEVILTVEQGCSLEVESAQVNLGIETADAEDGVYGSGTGSSLNVRCNLETPYTVSADTDAGGNFSLIGDTTGNGIASTLMQGSFGSQIPFGSLANNEHISGVGIGQWDMLPYQIQVNTGLGSVLPAADVYRHTITFTLEN